MKILLSKILSDKIAKRDELKSQLDNIAKNFDTFFSDFNTYDSSRIRKINASPANLYTLRVESKYRLIFTAKKDKRGDLYVVFLDLIDMSIQRKEFY